MFSTPTDPLKIRAEWVRQLRRLASPVLAAVREGRLHRDLPPRNKERAPYAPAEAFCRTLLGLAGWLDVDPSTLSPEEAVEHRTTLADVRVALEHIVDPHHPDRLMFAGEGRGSQFLVEAAFLSSALHRCRATVWDTLSEATRERLRRLIRSARDHHAGENNWLLFLAMVEGFLGSVGDADWRREPVERGFTAFAEWYKGDGVYGDGADFHWDYYNSYVVQPFLMELVSFLPPEDGRAWTSAREAIHRRAQRYAVVQERLIAPDGSFPAVGRSLCYRCGAFQHVAFMAWRGLLPSPLPPAQVRDALTAVILRTLDAPDTFDAQGFLLPGLYGHQPQLAEGYINTGSLYLATTAFLPLGRSPEDAFWRAPFSPWTSRRLTAGDVDVVIDKALH